MIKINALLLRLSSSLLRKIKKQEEIRERERYTKLMPHIPIGFGVGEGASIIGPQYISIGDGFYAARQFRLEAIDSYQAQRFSPRVMIGNNVYFGDYCHIGCIDCIEIGNGVMGGSKIYITDHLHGSGCSDELYLRPALRRLTSKPVCIGNNVLIGDGVCIMPGVKIGDNVIVGANTVVTHFFPANTIIAGCPARVIRELI